LLRRKKGLCRRRDHVARGQGGRLSLREQRKRGSMKGIGKEGAFIARIEIKGNWASPLEKKGHIFFRKEGGEMRKKA